MEAVQMKASDTLWTPGPWEACDRGAYTDFDGSSRVILGDEMRIAVVHVSKRDQRGNANARLIAASPELAAAAAEVLSYRVEGATLGYLRDSDGSRRALSRLAAALAEAEGN